MNCTNGKQLLEPSPDGQPPLLIARELFEAFGVFLIADTDGFGNHQ
jgi:hypothetical protein